VKQPQHMHLMTLQRRFQAQGEQSDVSSSVSSYPTAATDVFHVVSSVSDSRDFHLATPTKGVGKSDDY
jgi:hypothetical protein